MMLYNNATFRSSVLKINYIFDPEICHSVVLKRYIPPTSHFYHKQNYPGNDVNDLTVDSDGYIYFIKNSVQVFFLILKIFTIT